MKNKLQIISGVAAGLLTAFVLLRLWLTYGMASGHPVLSGHISTAVSCLFYIAIAVFMFGVYSYRGKIPQVRGMAVLRAIGIAVFVCLWLRNVVLYAFPSCYSSGYAALFTCLAIVLAVLAWVFYASKSEPGSHTQKSVSLFALASGIASIMAAVMLVAGCVMWFYFPDVLSFEIRRFCVGRAIDLCFLLCAATFMALKAS